MNNFPYTKEVDCKVIYLELNKNYRHYQEGIKIYEKCIPIFKSWIDKKITKVLRNKIASFIEPMGYKVYYYNEHSYRIEIWNNDFNKREREFTIYLNANDYLTEETVDQIIGQLERYKQWNKEIETMKKGTISTLVNEWNIKINELKELYEKVQKHNHISSHFKI